MSLLVSQGHPWVSTPDSMAALFPLLLWWEQGADGKVWIVARSALLWHTDLEEVIMIMAPRLASGVDVSSARGCGLCQSHFHS